MKKFLSAVLIIIQILTISGCSIENDNSKTQLSANSNKEYKQADSSESEIDSTDTIPATEDVKKTDTSTIDSESTAENKVVATLSGYRFGVMDTSNSDNIKEKLLSQILEFQNLSEEDIKERQATADYDFSEFYSAAYLNNKIDEITEFYYPEISIDGYTLYRAIIDEWSFLYYFGPNEKINSTSEYTFEFGDGILLGIDRTHWIDTDNPLDAQIKQYENRNKKYILKDNILYVEGYDSIEGIIGNTRFTLHGPDDACDYDSLFALAKKVIESTELIEISKQK